MNDRKKLFCKNTKLNVLSFYMNLMHNVSDLLSSPTAALEAEAVRNVLVGR